MNNGIKALFVIAGHGLKNDGSLIEDNGASYDGLIERDLTKVISKNLYDKLDLVKDFKTYHIGFDKDVSRDAKVSKVNRICKKEGYDYKNSILIEIHTNTGGGTGSETLGYLGHKGNDELCNTLLVNVASATGLSNRGLKDGKPYDLVKQTLPLALLFECAFLDTGKDRSKFIYNIESFSDGLFNGLKEYIGFEEIIIIDYKKLYDESQEKLNKIKEFVKNI